MNFEIPKQANEETAWWAGREFALHGVAAEDCRFPLFARPELARSWERGKKAGEWEKTQSPNAKVTGSPALSASPCGLPGSAAG